jgi:hypothetical protein
MKEVIEVNLRTDGDPSYGSFMPENAMKRLLLRFPDDSAFPGTIRFIREADSDDLKEFYRIIYEQAGLRPTKGPYPFKGRDLRGEFNYLSRITHSKTEILAADFAEVNPFYSYCNGNRYSDVGEPIMDRIEIKKIPIGCAGRCETFCNDSTKRKMEAVGFAGLCFRPVIVVGRRPVKEVEPVWQLWSDFAMPLMNNPKADKEGTPIGLDVDGLQGCFINENPLLPPVRYSRRALDLCKDLDVVRSSEHFGGDELRAKRVPRLFCSKRFRKWCAEEKLKINWNPVFFEDDSPLDFGV